MDIDPIICRDCLKIIGYKIGWAILVITNQDYFCADCAKKHQEERKKFRE
jgi:hypothetical protein